MAGAVSESGSAPAKNTKRYDFRRGFYSIVKERSLSIRTERPLCSCQAKFLARKIEVFENNRVLDFLTPICANLTHDLADLRPLLANLTNVFANLSLTFANLIFDWEFSLSINLLHVDNVDVVDLMDKLHPFLARTPPLRAKEALANAGNLGAPNA